MVLLWLVFVISRSVAQWKRVQERSEHPFKSALTCWADFKIPLYGVLKNTLARKTENMEEKELQSDMSGEDFLIYIRRVLNTDFKELRSQ